MTLEKIILQRQGVATVSRQQCAQTAMLGSDLYQRLERPRPVNSTFYDRCKPSEWPFFLLHGGT